MTLLLRALGILAVCLAVVGCGDDGAVAGTDTDGGSTTFSTTFPDPTIDPQTSGTSMGGGETESTTGPDASSTVTGFDPPEPECGNGFVEGDEQCDDGNTEDGDGCSASCLIPCGLEWSATALPLTAQSPIDPVAIASGPDGRVVAVARQREVTTDQRGNETVGPNEAAVVSLDAEGVAAWDVRLSGPVDRLLPRDVVLDAAGDVYVAGDADSVNGDGDIFVAKLSGTDGTTIWTHVVDSAIDTAEDAAHGIAIAPDGNPVVSGQVRVGDADDDVFVRKLDAADGSEIWTSTWNGAATGTFSTDDGGPVAVASDGAVYVLAEEYVDFQTQLVTLLRFPADGGAVQWTHTFSFPGSVQQYLSLAVDTDAQGDVYAAFVRLLGAGNEFYLFKLGSDQSVAWQLTADGLVGPDSNATIDGVHVTEGGELLVAGTVGDDDQIPGEVIIAAWIARTDLQGELVCFVQQEGPQEGLLPPELSAADVTSVADGGAALVADLVDEGDQALWIGRFRPE